MAYFEIHAESGKTKIEVSSPRLSPGQVPEDVKFVDYVDERFRVPVNSEGYYLLPNAVTEPGAPRRSALTRFHERPDFEAAVSRGAMPIYGLNCGNGGWLCVVEGMELSFNIIVRLENGFYQLIVRFLDDEFPYEDMFINFIELGKDECDYSGMARRYRKYQLERGACKYLKDRFAAQPVLEESLQGPLVRIRLCWKPVPSPVPEQTEENEPPIKVALTFDQVVAIMEEFHRQGIEHAEFQLVGWNKSGHDGRFPDLLPVEPLIGGEEGLKRVIAKAKQLGYLISCHTEIISGYTIAKRFHEDLKLVDRHGGNEVSPMAWSGGTAYRFCPKEAVDKILMDDLKLFQEFGFSGTHYLDVATILAPTNCYHPDHPLNRREAGFWRGESLRLVREAVGASGSESGWDFCIGEMDYSLYAAFQLKPPLAACCDEQVPFWHLVYHGIVSYNSYTDTVNTCIKADPALRLWNFEAGGRPLAYYFSAFTADNWMGDEDLRGLTPERIAREVRNIKTEYDQYRTLSDLQTVPMFSHETLADNVVRMTYENGEKVIFNKTENAFDYEGTVIAPYSFFRTK